jgi:squalene-associated FAD-dependent desaturase
MPDARTNVRESVVIIGGGLAGIAAACKLISGGYQVTLIERKPYLGGRASSFRDPQTGMLVDNGQHVFLRCCTAFIDLLNTLDTLHLTRIQPRFSVKVAGSTGRVARLTSSPLPTPLHLLPSFLTYSHLGTREKLQAIRAILRLCLVNPLQYDLERQSFYDWLKTHGQSDRAIEHFWDLVILAALNDKSRNASTSMGAMVFKEALLKGRHGADIGYATTGLLEAIGNAARRHIEQHGGRLLMGTGASEFIMSQQQLLGIRLDSGETLQARWYVSALPHHALLGLLPPHVSSEPYFMGLRSLSSAPIINLHLWYDYKVMDDEFVAFVGSPLQWVFNKSRMLGLDTAGGQYLTVSLSGAETYVEKSDDELRSMFLPQIARAFPQAKDARIQRFIVTREAYATCRVMPGTARLRPSTITPIAGFLVAGDWTNTGWPSTMEGAVRSGNKAADVILCGDNP